MKNKMISTAAALACAAISSPLAFAEEAGENKDAAQSWLERDSLFISQATESLSKKTGFTPALSWTGEVWSNVSSGSDTHTMFDSLFTLELEQDLSVLAGKEGFGRIGASAFYYAQTSKDNALGGLDSSQGCWSNIVGGDMLRVFEIFYANEFEGDAGSFSLRVGQLAADEDFMGMDYSDVFLNSSFGAMPNIAPAQLFSQYNVATLGLVVGYAKDNLDVLAGVYNGNVGADISSNNGFDYAGTFETVAVWYQIGYNYAIGDLDGRVMVGGNWHSDPSRVNFDQIDAHSFYSFYAGVQQALVNDSEGNAKFGVYARVGVVPESKHSDQNFYADFGFNWFSPLPGREDDVFAAGFSVIENEGDSRYVGGYSHYEGALEITYKCQLTPAIAIQPDFQLFTNPNGTKGAAYVVGARAQVVF